MSLAIVRFNCRLNNAICVGKYRTFCMLFSLMGSRSQQPFKNPINTIQDSVVIVTSPWRNGIVIIFYDSYKIWVSLDKFQWRYQFWWWLSVENTLIRWSIEILKDGRRRVGLPITSGRPVESSRRLAQSSSFLRTSLSKRYIYINMLVYIIIAYSRNRHSVGFRRERRPLEISQWSRWVCRSCCCFGCWDCQRYRNRFSEAVPAGLTIEVRRMCNDGMGC